MIIFSRQSCELGESPLWHPQRQSLFWLDILGKKLYEKRLTSSNSDFDRSWMLPEHASFLAADKKNPDLLWMVTNKSFGKFDVSAGTFVPVLELPIEEDMRANDGGVSLNGYLWFGTMQWRPKGSRGKIYSISPSGELQVHAPSIGIPNTFVWNPDGSKFYFSDSLAQIIRRCLVVDGAIDWRACDNFADLSGSRATPDGGAMDLTEQLWNAQWDGGKVVAYDKDGLITATLTLPVPRPTSCCFGGPDYKHLFVTSARCDMSANELIAAPASGNVFVTELEVAGAHSSANFFHMDT